MVVGWQDSDAVISVQPNTWMLWKLEQFQNVNWISVLPASSKILELVSHILKNNLHETPLYFCVLFGECIGLYLLNVMFL